MILSAVNLSISTRVIVGEKTQDRRLEIPIDPAVRTAGSVDKGTTEAARLEVRT